MQESFSSVKNLLGWGYTVIAGLLLVLIQNLNLLAPRSRDKEETTTAVGYCFYILCNLCDKPSESTSAPDSSFGLAMEVI